jgi:uncharacterized protein (DUF2062 family)
VTVETPSPVPHPKRTLWQKRVRDPIVAQLTQGITPHKIALTLAVGSACALFPLLGTTTLLCLLAGIVLRLNQPMIQMVNFLCYPIHIPLIFYMVHWGRRLFGETNTRFGMRELKAFGNLLWDDFPAFMHRFGTTALEATVVWAIAAPIWIALIYYSTLPMLKEIARLKAEAAVKTAAMKPPEHPVP